jgi:tRNA nucleotidyltransferase (CCA-adding enzyme)
MAFVARFEYFEHGADVGIVGRGADLETAFAEAGAALFDLIVDLERVNPAREVRIECRAANREELLVEWLNVLLAEADLRRLVFCRFSVNSLSPTHLEGSAWGERLDRQRHAPKIEVKAATYSMLAVGKDDEGFFARCVVDV